jgi:hypothetical protein
MFPQLVQQQLDKFRLYWNAHTIRKQKDKANPSGFSPDYLMAYWDSIPGTVDCRIPVHLEVVAEMRAILDEEVGTRDEHLRWSTDEFSTVAEAVFEQLGSPALTFSIAWDVFGAMIPLVQDIMISL